MTEIPNVGPRNGQAQNHGCALWWLGQSSAGEQLQEWLFGPDTQVVSSEPVTSFHGQDEITQSLAAGGGICACRAAQGGSRGNSWPGRCHSKEQHSLIRVSDCGGQNLFSSLHQHRVSNN